MGINPLDFYHTLAEKNIRFFTGVPDSLLKEFCLAVDDNLSCKNHIIAANEGSSIAIGAGYHFSSGLVPLVYMQNSGLGNAVNPLLSLCDKEVYSVPILLMIGWRGEPGVKDEPQHVKQGKIQIELLNIMDIPYEIVSKENVIDYKIKIANLLEIARLEDRPVSLVIKKGTFEKYDNKTKVEPNNYMSREDALEIILDKLDKDAVIVSTTGKTSREIFEIRSRNGQSHQQDFLTVGSMGHCSSIALGIALEKPDRQVVCIDGDGAMIMHMGSLTNIASAKPRNFYHILINNEAHESVGGQSTSATFINLAELVKANGYQFISTVSDKKLLRNNFEKFINVSGPNFLEVKVKVGSRSDLGRPTTSPINNKKSFMKFLKSK